MKNTVIRNLPHSVALDFWHCIYWEKCCHGIFTFRSAYSVCVQFVTCSIYQFSRWCVLYSRLLCSSLASTPHVMQLFTMLTVNRRVPYIRGFPYCLYISGVYTLCSIWLVTTGCCFSLSNTHSI